MFLVFKVQIRQCPVNNLLLKENVPYNLKYLLGLLNSHLLRFYYVSRFTNKSSLTVDTSNTFLDELPILPINLSDSVEKAQHNKMVSFVEQMLALNKKIELAQTPQEKERLKRQITVTVQEIDSLVYELYGLNDDEIRIVEGGFLKNKI